jgi:phosphate butyryltransferase
LNECHDLGRLKIVVAVAQDQDVLQSVKMAEDLGLTDSILVGSGTDIERLTKTLEIKMAQVINEEDENIAANLATEIVSEQKADILMKGLINSSDFLRAVVARKKTPFLSHLGVFEISNRSKLLFMTDGGMNINPDLEQKREILINAINALKCFGIDNPKIAILTANEKVHPKMQSTLDAQELVRMRATGEIMTGIIEGPIALDVAFSPEAAKHKGIQSNISGDVDLFLVHNIETGNIWGKSLIYYSNAKMAGLVVGADYPMVMTSRVETPEGKLNSIAIACLIAGKKSQR